MSFNTFYLVSLLAVHFALFLCLFFALHEVKTPGWRLAVHSLCSFALVTQIVGVYEVIPALWWPGADLNFRHQVAMCLPPFFLSLVVLAIGHFMRERKRKALAKGLDPSELVFKL